MRNVVLDTNCLLICVAKNSKFHSVWTAFLNEEFRMSVMIIQIILNSENVDFVNPSYRFGLIVADPDDNKFVDCAIIANADYIVSQDTHFDILKTINFPKVHVIRIEEFTEELKNGLLT